MSDIDRGAIEERVIPLVARDLDVPSVRVLATSRLRDDLDMNDLEEVEFQLSLEEEFDIIIHEGDFDKVATVKDVVDYIATQVRSTTTRS